MQPILFNLESDHDLAQALAIEVDAEVGKLDLRNFPDGESYLRVLSECQHRSVIVLCNLHHPDEKILKLTFLTHTLKSLGASRIGLVTPYLAYMRQDKAFHHGEAVSSRPFAHLLSEQFDWLVTLDPHLHRYNSLDEIYSLKSSVVHAAPMIADWINRHIPQPLLIGPDSESEQWVSEVAHLAEAPFQVLEKVRHGDYSVEVSVPEVEQWKGHTPVLVDDIISSGKTMLETITHLHQLGLKSPTCIGVHGLFSDEDFNTLAIKANIVTCNSVPHSSNDIDISHALSEAILKWI
ncbi:ribose-phosphate pyrophosphokinase [Neptuniibacter sp. SY11_33]|uniref:ribose-phosphate pyrophosphokinase n=1 Tax=Neptuniibacter sp. SY11_33 TaxID=3398215 RepID=UPI0039F4B4C5